MRPILALFFAVAALLPLVAATSGVGVPQAGPDVPAATAPTGVVVFRNERFFGTDEVRTRTVAVPAAWDRVVLVFSENPLGDPWDRTFGVALGDVEVLHGTTPRHNFSLQKDVTRFGALLPAAGDANVSIKIDTWVGGQEVNVDLLFYADEPTALLVERPADAALGPFRWIGLCGHGQGRTTNVTFPAATPSKAVVEFTISGHGSMEFQYGSIFHVYVDGVEVARAVQPPYTYAFLGFSGANGQQNPTTLLIHQALWWTAQQGLDLVGVHGGVGEIPPSRALVPADLLPTLTGDRTVEIVQERLNGCTWLTSVGILVYA
jgi:peptide N-acetyl-beta-D-glucosaminyl asparaginase amidase A